MGTSVEHTGVVGNLNYLVFSATASRVEIAFYLREKGASVLGFQAERQEEEEIVRRRTHMLRHGRDKPVAVVEAILADFGETLRRASEAKKHGAEEVYIVSTRRFLTVEHRWLLSTSPVAILFLASPLANEHHHYKFCYL